MVLQELASASKVTLQDQDGRLIEVLKENLVTQFEAAVLNRDAGWIRRLAKAVDKIENCSAQFLAVCWMVHVEFKVHHPSRHGRPI
jgi:hypothetical protein